MSSYGTSLTAIAICTMRVGFVSRLWLGVMLSTVVVASLYSVAGFDSTSSLTELVAPSRHVLLLVRDATEVGSVAHAVTRAEELQGLDALDVADAGRPVDAGVSVPDARRETHVHAADGVGHLDDATPGDLRGERDVRVSTCEIVFTTHDRPPSEYDGLSGCLLIAEDWLPSSRCRKESGPSGRGGTRSPSRGGVHRRCARAC